MTFRAQLSVTTAGLRLISIADGAVAINDSEFPALITALTGASGFDMPINGRLRYIGSTSARVLVQMTIVASVDTTWPGRNYEFRLAQNGSAIEPSKVGVELTSTEVTEAVALQTLVDLSPNDYLEATVTAPSLGVGMTISDLATQIVGEEILISPGSPVGAGGFAQMAARLIARRGETLTHQQVTGASYDASTRTYSGGSQTDTDFTAFVAEYEDREIDGSAIRRGDLKVWVADTELLAQSILPVTGDFVSRGGVPYLVERLSQPAGDGIVTILQLRGTA